MLLRCNYLNFFIIFVCSSKVTSIHELAIQLWGSIKNAILPGNTGTENANEMFPCFMHLFPLVLLPVLNRLFSQSLY